ncbi:hypothetical protein MY8738_008101 [Beauveria namnaoensis]
MICHKSRLRGLPEQLLGRFGMAICTCTTKERVSTDKAAEDGEFEEKFRFERTKFKSPELAALAATSLSQEPNAYLNLSPGDPLCRT